MKYPIASPLSAYENMLLQPVFPMKDPDPEHRITSITELDDGRFLVKTNFGEWPFARDEPILFPRRPDGSRIDWTQRDNLPHVRELCPGDIVGPGKPSPEIKRLLEMSGVETMDELKGHPNEEFIRKLHADESLVVRRISQYLKTDFWEVTCVPLKVSVGQKERRFKCAPAQLFDPANHVPPKTVKEPRKTEYTQHGPYVDRVTGRVLFFAVHPTGRGRWASWLERPFPGLPDDGKIHPSRPPSNASDIAAFFEFRADERIPDESLPELMVGNVMWGERHPKDPLQ